MTVLIDTSKVVDVLLPTGWYMCTAGTFIIEELALQQPVPGGKLDEEYGFDFIDQGGQRITGRLSALIAVRMNP